MSTEGSSKGRGGEAVVSEELCQAAILMQESIRCIQAYEKKMIDAGRRDSADHKNLLELKSDMFELSEKIFRLADPETQRRIRAIENDEQIRVQILDQVRIGQEEDREELLDLAANETQLNTTVCESDEYSVSSEETLLPTWISDVVSRYEADGGDIASLLESEKTREEAEAVLSFGFNLHLFGQQIDELRRELRRLVMSFSPDNKDVKGTMIMLTREPYLHGIAKLQWISKHISMLRLMDPDLDSKVQATTMKMRSESFSSSLLKEEERVNREGVTTGEDGGNFSVEMDKKRFAAYRLCWERTWGNGYSFENQTLLSPMQFTHCKPSRNPADADAVAGSSLQIYSIEVSPKGDVEWPLKVYGVVTARDSVDRQRNPIFIRTRNYCQILTEKDPFLRLTGPVRAIVSMDTVYIEAELKAKGTRKSEDVVLASTFINPNKLKGDHFSTSLADNYFCTIEMCFEELEQSVQATVVSVVVKSKPGSVPFQYGGKIMCSSVPCCNGSEDFVGLPHRKAVLFDSADGELIRDRAGHLDLSRRVVSVELKGKLQFQIQAYSQPDSAEIDAQVLLFTPRKWNISKEACCLGDGSEVEITIAWSLLPSKMLS